MSATNATLLIERIENFHEVWSDGFNGDFLTVAKRLADYNTGSLQTAKRTIKTPTLLSCPSSRIEAVTHAAEFEKCGLNCRIRHIGKSRLDAVADSTIIDTLTLQGSVPLTSVYADQDAKFIFHTAKDGITGINIDSETEEGFCLYLACLRHLVRRNMIQELDAASRDRLA